MSIHSLEEKFSTIEKGDNLNSNKINYTSDPKQKYEEEEKIVQYKNLPYDLNSVSLKTRFTCRKMLDLMENNKNEDLTLEDLNDSSKAEINRQKLNRKLIQYYCLENAEKNKFAAPSEKTLSKIQQFKKWQNFEIFQKNGIKNYLNNILPDYKLVFKTKNIIDNKINLYTKLKIRKNFDSTILPNIDTNTNSYNNKYFQFNKYLKDTDIFNNQSKSSNISINDRNNSQLRNIGNKSFENSSKSSNIINPNTLASKFKNKKKNKSIIKNNRSSSLMNLIINTNKTNLNLIKSFEGSTFCYSGVKKPLSINKSITTSPYGGGIYHSNSLFRNKSMNDLLSNPSQKKILERLNEYQTKRTRIINSKDYLQHIGKTFVTINKHLGNYDYNIF